MTRRLRPFMTALLALVVPTLLAAQRVTVNLPPGTPPARIQGATRVSVGATFAYTPATPSLTQTSGQGNICNPGACFASSLSVAANQRWQLQVRVRPTAPNNFYVNWITPAPQAQVRLNSVWTTIRSATTTSTGTSVPLLFNANRVSGNGGSTPNAAQLTSYLEYQVVALP